MQFQRFTEREVSLFRKLLSMKSFQAGTKEQIARQLDGHRANQVTRQFLEKLIQLSCLTFVEERMMRAGRGNDERPVPVYTRDIEQMMRVWMRTEEYALSAWILDKKSLLVVTSRDILGRQGEGE
jgi:hypothetical protein